MMVKDTIKRIRQAAKQMYKDARGMSLVEGIVGLAIVTITSLFLATGFMFSAVNIGRGTKIQQAGREMSKQAEEEIINTSQGTSKIISFNVAGQPNAEVMGRLVTKSDKETGVTYTIFEAKK